MTIKDNNETIRFEMYFDDLNDRAKDAIINTFGDNFNWDTFPMFTMEIDKYPNEM